MEQANLGCNGTVNAELLYIIQRYLSSTRCSQAARVLQQEIDEQNLLPARLDWLGKTHPQTFSQFDVENAAHVPRNLLPRVFGSLLDRLSTSLPMAVPFIRPRLIQSGHQYILRTNDSIKPRHRMEDGLRPPKWDCRLSKSSTTSVCEPPATWQLLNYQMTGRLRKRHVLSAIVLPHLKEQHRVLGHLSCVFCIVFDRTGQYLFTGADDNLVKVWQVEGARLLFTFRGCSGEITDLAVSHENTLLAAASVDRTVRVWCLRTGNLISVLMGHSAMVTSVQFLPYVNGDTRFLLSTSNDCCVCFWMWNKETYTFEKEPTKYSERERVGSQMICSSHSPSGAFVVTGCTDHHLRVYKLSPQDGIERILEVEAHTDRVDSLRWAHRGLRFASGSKDGTVKIWTFARQKWRHILLNVADTKPKKLSTESEAVTSSNPTTKATRTRVTMVGWSGDDSIIVTAASDSILRVWDSFSGNVLRFLHGHKDDAFVLECHPLHSDIILSAGHDGYLILWDIVKGVEVCRHHNAIEGQGFGAIFDGTFSPVDASLVAAVDSHGHLIILRAGGSDKLRKETPTEQFFHTDYRPIIRDANGFILDEQTQMAPQLMPPPFLVQSNGNPCPPNLQRRVPGREKCPQSFLSPITVARTAESDNVEVDIVDVHDVHVEDTLNHSVADNTLEAPRSSDTDSLPLCVWTQRSLINALDVHAMQISIAIRLELQREELEYFDKQMNAIEANPIQSRTIEDDDHPLSIVQSVRRRQVEQRKKKSHVYGTRTNIQPTGRSIRGSTMEESTTPLVQPSSPSEHEVEGEEEEEETTSSSSSAITSDSEYEEGADTKKRSRRKNKSPTRRSNRRVKEVGRHSEEELVEEMEQIEADENIDYEKEDEPCTSTGRKRKRGSPPIPRPIRKMTPEMPKKKHISVLRTRKKSVRDVDAHTMPSFMAEFPSWLLAVEPRKFPYFPQVGDEIVYFPAGHRVYYEAVEKNKVYEITAKMRPKNDFDGEEFGLVEEVSYELEPYRLCCLKIAQIHATTKNLTGRVYKIWYHDVDGVVDFIVLRTHFDRGVAQKWKPGNRFQSLIDDCWWFGTIEKRESFDVEFPHCPFQSLWVTWDNGENERMSPWDLEEFQEDIYVKRKGADLKATACDYARVAEWNTNEYDWPVDEPDEVIKRLESVIHSVESQPYVQCFLQPVDLREYPLYPASVPCPIDMYTIILRLKAKFYRRLAAVEFDVRLIAENAERFNEQNSEIVKYSHIFCETMLRFLRDPQVDVYDTFVHLDENDCIDSFSHLLRSNFQDTPLKKVPKKKSHKAEEHLAKRMNVMSECKQLMISILENADAAPFLGDNSSPELSDVFDSFMNLSQVRDRLLDNKYENPEDLATDVNSMLQNVRNIATNKRSHIFKCALRLSSLFMERIRPLVERWKTLTGANDVIYGEHKAYNTRTQRRPVFGNRRVSNRRRVVAHLSSEGEEEIEEAPGPSNRFLAPDIVNESFETNNGDTDDKESPATNYKRRKTDLKEAETLGHEEEVEELNAESSNSDDQENEEELDEEDEEEEEVDSSSSDYSDTPRPRRQPPPKLPPRPKPSIRPQLRLKNERDLDEESFTDSPPPRSANRKKANKRNSSPADGSTGRLRGARRVDYNENSDDEEAADKQVISTSSRGRVRKVRRFT